MPIKPVYLDYNSNAPLYQEAVERMLEVSSYVGSASSVHRFGRDARKILEQARKEIAAVVSAKMDEIVFTSGASESNTMVLDGYARAGAEIWISAIEHASVRQVLKPSVTLEVDADGVLILEKLEERLNNRVTEQPVVVCVMAANNETGVIQPIKEVAWLCKKYGARFHCDAVQALGRLPLNFSELGADTVSLSAHKVGGPIGIGALLMKEGITVPPLVRGASQERGRRAGTQNHMLAAGFSAALRCVMAEDWDAVAKLRDYLESALMGVDHEVMIFGKYAQRLPNTSSFAMQGVKNEVQVMGFDLEGFAVSAGSACSSGTLQPSTVLRAMGVSDDIARTSIRVSLKPRTTHDEIDAFVRAWCTIKDRARSLQSKMTLEINQTPQHNTSQYEERI